MATNLNTFIQVEGFNPFEKSMKNPKSTNPSTRQLHASGTAAPLAPLAPLALCPGMMKKASGKGGGDGTKWGFF